MELVGDGSPIPQAVLCSDAETIALVSKFGTDVHGNPEEFIHVTGNNLHLLKLVCPRQN
jgi:hypothetical protein